MQRIRSILSFGLIMLCVICIQKLNAQNKDLKIDYFGQTPPGNKAVEFAPDFFSKHYPFIQCCSFSPDGKEFIFSITDKDWAPPVIMITRFINNKWTEPDTLFKQGSVCFFSPDGQHIYMNKRPFGNNKSMDLYVSTKTASGWGEQVRVPFPINTDDASEPEMCQSGPGTIFFSSDRTGGYGNVDVYLAKLINGSYKVENLGPGINTSAHDECPAIAIDESFLVFNSWRNGTNGLNELFVSFKKKNGLWTYPKILGPAVNTNQLDIYPNITPDGKYIIFTRREASRPSSLYSRLYWVSIQLIDSLKHTNFDPYCKYSIPNLNAIAGVPFNYQIPDSIFVDDDENDTLSYSASNMPDWLSFDPKTKTFSGTPTLNTVTKLITVTATDLAQSSITSQFIITFKAPDADVKTGHPAK